MSLYYFSVAIANFEGTSALVSASSKEEALEKLVGRFKEDLYNSMKLGKFTLSDEEIVKRSNYYRDRFNKMNYSVIESLDDVLEFDSYYI